MANARLSLGDIGLRIEELELEVDALLHVVQRSILCEEYELDRDLTAAAIDILDAKQHEMRGLWQEKVIAERKMAADSAHSTEAPL